MLRGFSLSIIRETRAHCDYIHVRCTGINDALQPLCPLSSHSQQALVGLYTSVHSLSRIVARTCLVT